MIYNDPLGLGAKDQIGTGITWNVTNRSAFDDQRTRSSETVAEAYYNHFFMKWLQLGPDVQVIFNPALDPHSSAAAIITFRVAGAF